MTRRGLRLSATALVALLAGCSGSVVPPARPAPPRPAPVPAGRPAPPRPLPPVQTPSPALAAAPDANAAALGWVAGPAVGDLPFDEVQAARALAAFRLTCPALIRRNDGTGLTRGADWQGVCDAARSVPDRQARAFFAASFETLQIGDGRAFATGYYEPEIKGSRTRQPGYEVPVYGRPTDLVEVDLGLFQKPQRAARAGPGGGCRARPL